MTNQSPSLGGSDGVIAVQIIGAPLACADGVKDTWREVAKHTADQLSARFGDRVRVQYLDLFGACCHALLDGAHLPLVLIEGEALRSGGKISTPAIRKCVEAFGVTPHGH